MKFIHLIWSNLKRKKLRTGLTLLSILVAFVLFGLLSSIKQALSGGITLEGANRLVVRQKVSIINSLPESYKARMERIPGVALAVHQTWFGGIYKEAKNFFMQTPVVPEEFLDMHPEFVLSPEQKQAWLQTRTGAIVGRKTAERFGWKIGDKIPIQSPIWAQSDGSRTWTFDIVGIYSGRDKNTDTTPLFFRYDYFEEARGRSKGEVGWYTIRVNDPSKAAAIAKQVDQEFENSPYETKTEPVGAFVQGWRSRLATSPLLPRPLWARCSSQSCW
jgi:putative ABC transport system permease protein